MFYKVFSGGEVNVQLDQLSSVTGPRAQIGCPDYTTDRLLFIEGSPDITLDFDLKSSDDFFALAMAAEALRDDRPESKLHAIIRYVPYARQDRHMRPGDAHGIKVFAGLLNSLKFESVTIWDPHSDVTPALINNVRIVSQQQLVLALMADYFKEKDALIMAPDAGAVKKAYSLAEAVGCDLTFATKKRSTKDNSISSTTIDRSILVDSRKILIVDDICDGGRTFIELAKMIRSFDSFNDTARVIDLYVTHGIFSRGVEPLFHDGLINSIYCANNINKHRGVIDFNSKIPF